MPKKPSKRAKVVAATIAGAGIAGGLAMRDSMTKKELKRKDTMIREMGDAHRGKRRAEFEWLALELHRPDILKLLEEGHREEINSIAEESKTSPLMTLHTLTSAQHFFDLNKGKEISEFEIPYPEDKLNPKQKTAYSEGVKAVIEAFQARIEKGPLNFLPLHSAILKIDRRHVNQVFWQYYPPEAAKPPPRPEIKKDKPAKTIDLDYNPA